MRALVSSLVVAAVLATLGAPPASAQGVFGPAPQVELSQDGRTLKLLRAFTFTDARQVRWVAPRDWVVDGASIPKPFWSFLGGPLEGLYRDASIIHDYYCDTKTRPWKQVHRAFYEGMIARGLPAAQAKLMYFAVYRFGPRWEQKVTRVPGVSFSGTAIMVEQTVVIDLPPPEYDDAIVAGAQALIDQGGDLEALERLSDEAGSGPSPSGLSAQDG